MNHCPKCIDIWYGVSLVQAIQSCSNIVSGVTDDHALKGDKVLYGKKLQTSFSMNR